MADEWKNTFDSLIAPAAGAMEVTPNDELNLSKYAKTVYIGGDGDLRITTVDDDVVTFTGMKGGSYLPVRVKRIWSTGTTATGIIALI